MKRLVISSTTTYGNSGHIADSKNYSELFTAGAPNTSGIYLASGEMAFFDADTQLVIRADGYIGTGGTAVAKRWFAAVNEGGDIVCSPVVTIAKRSAWTKEAYAAAVAQVIKVGSNGATLDLTAPLSPVPGDVMSVRVFDLSKPSWDGRRERLYQYVCKPSDTRVTMVDGLVAMINADVTRKVNALKITQSTNLGIQFTAKTAGLPIMVKPEDNIYGSTVATTTANVSPVGTTAVVQALELDRSTERGNLNSFYMNRELYSVPSAVVAGVAYDYYTCTFETDLNDNKMIGGDKLTGEFTLVVNSDTLTATIAAMIAAAGI